MADIYQLGYSIDTSQVLQGENALDELTESTIKAEGATKRLKTSSAEMGASVGRAGQQASNLGRSAGIGAGGIRNLGLQLNQVAQQGSVTGNYMQALSIQLPDLLLGFGTLGIFAGVAAGALGPLALSLLSSGDAVKEVEDAFDNLSSAVDRHRTAAAMASLSIGDLREEFGFFSEELRETLNILQEIALAKAIDSLNEAINALDTDRLRQLVTIFDDGAGEMSIVSETYNKAVKALAEEFQLTGDQASILVQKLNSLGDADGPRNVALAARDLNQYMVQTFGSVQAIPPEMRAMVQRLAEADVEASRILKTTEDTAAATRDATDATSNWAAQMTGVRAELNAIAAIIASLGGGAITAAAKRTEIAALQAGNSIKDAARAASEFKENLKVDAQIMGLESRFGKVGTAIGGLIRGQVDYNRELDRTLETERQSALEREKAAAIAARGGGGGRTGGSARSGEYERNLASLLESLGSEREALEVWYAESEALLNDHRARKFLGEEEHKAAMFALDAEYAARQQDLASQTAQHEIDAKRAAVDGITGLLGVLAGKSRGAAIALIAISKGQAIAQAIQNTAVAKMRALAELGPIAGPPAAQAIGVMGKIQVAAIAATGLAQAAGAGGSGGGGSVSGGMSATAPQEPERAPQQVTIDMPNAPRWLKEMSEEIFGQFQEQINEGRELAFQ